MSETFQLETKSGWLDVNEIERNKISTLCFIQRLKDEVELKSRKLVKVDSCFDVEDFEKLYPEVLEEWLVEKEKLKKIYADYNYKKDDKKPNKEKDERQAILHSFLPLDFYKFLHKKKSGNRNFICSSNRLTSLAGNPKTVNGSFIYEEHDKDDY